MRRKTIVAGTPILVSKDMATISSVACTRSVWPDEYTVEATIDSERKVELAGRPPGGSFTIQEWCTYRRMSISMYYKLRSQGKGPATLDVGRHKTITAEADAAWVRQQQAASFPANHITTDDDGKLVVAPAHAA
jgi:hypothetical protein